MFSDREELVLQYLKTKNQKLREKIVLAYKPLTDYIARKMAYNRDDLEDIIQISTIALLKSLERYNPNKEVDFSSFASPNIIGEIKHYYRDKGNLIKIPRRIQETYSKIKNFIKVFTQEQKRAPTIKEISATIDVPADTILEVLETIQLTNIVSLDAPLYNENVSKGTDHLTLMNSLGVKPSHSFLLTEEHLKEALKHINEREKYIIFLKFYEGYSQREIAEKIHMSQMHVSRLLNSALKALKKEIIKTKKTDEEEQGG